MKWGPAGGYGLPWNPHLSEPASSEPACHFGRYRSITLSSEMFLFKWIYLCKPVSWGGFIWVPAYAKTSKPDLTSWPVLLGISVTGDLSSHTDAWWAEPFSDLGCWWVATLDCSCLFPRCWPECARQHGVLPTRGRLCSAPPCERCLSPSCCCLLLHHLPVFL